LGLSHSGGRIRNDNRIVADKTAERVLVRGGVAPGTRHQTVFILTIETIVSPAIRESGGVIIWIWMFVGGPGVKLTATVSGFVTASLLSVTRIHPVPGALGEKNH
jgi:hypothetical protein